MPRTAVGESSLTNSSIRLQQARGGKKRVNASPKIITRGLAGLKILLASGQTGMDGLWEITEYANKLADCHPL